MSAFKIESGIKIPPPRVGGSKGRVSRVVVTMRLLKKGESFLIADALDALRGGKLVRNFNARLRAEKKPQAFVSRQMGSGLRIWRVR